MPYKLIIEWSKADESFVVEVPELSGCMADGATYEEAIANAQTSSRSGSRPPSHWPPIPEPKGKLAYA